MWEKEENLNTTLSYDDQEIQQVVWDVCEQNGIDPDIPSETRPLLRQIVEQYTGDADAASFANWLTSEIPRHFIASQIGRNGFRVQIGLGPMASR